jgi:hypothetical protein
MVERANVLANGIRRMLSLFTENRGIIMKNAAATRK